MLQVVVTYLVLAALLFCSSGRLNWIWAWAYLGVGFGILVINVVILPADLTIADCGPRGAGNLEGMASRGLWSDSRVNS
jgi:hypothetical protein